MDINIKNIYEWPVTTRLLVLGLITALAFYGGYYWDLSQLRGSLQEGQQKEEELKNQLSLVLEKKAILEKTLSQYAVTKKLLADWQAKFIKHISLPELLNEILKLGANNNLYFTLFNPEDAIEERNYEKVPIKVIVVGNYHQISDFISQIANMKWIVVTGNFLITNENKNDVLGSKLAAQASAQGLLTGEINFAIYHISTKKPEDIHKKKEPGKSDTEKKDAPVTEQKGEVV